MKNNDHNNNVNHKFGQLGLDGEKADFPEKLRGFTLKLLEILYLNSNRAYCPKELMKMCPEVHPNTIHNFIQRAYQAGWIVHLKTIKGSSIVGMYHVYKEPDILATGQVVPNKKYKYYQITNEGKRIFELQNAYYP